MDNGSGKDYENMSDDDFANQSVPDPVEQPVAEVVTPEPTQAPEAEALAPETVEDPEIPESEATAGEAVEEDENEDLSDEEIAAGPKSVEAKAEPDTAKVETKTDESVIDYKAAYDSIMAPFQANGRKFTPENPEEAIRLMQMGANYAKKMESLKPNLKTMRMLDNHGLLSEEKVSFLIDLSKNDPGAIAKLLKEAKIDPLDLDTSDETTYRPGVHTVSDTEMAFHDSLTEVASTPEGKETVSHINTHWDKTSKEMVYKEPALLQIINQQRANGIYDQITAEIEQMKVFGKIAPNTPFIEAYRQAGDHLQSQGKLTAAQPQATAPTPAPTALETRTVARRQALPNGEKAKAASPAKASAKAASKEFNPFDMSDEEIMALPSPRG